MGLLVRYGSKDGFKRIQGSCNHKNWTTIDICVAELSFQFVNN